MIAMTAQQRLSTTYKVLKWIECSGSHLMIIEWFMLGFQKPIKAVAALISAGIVTAIEYQKFQLISGMNTIIDI